MANQTETPETPSGRRWRAASSAWLFWMGRDPGQVTCSTHSHGREVPAQPHFQPGADTSQLRWRNPGATKKPAVVSPAYSVFFSTSVYLQVSSSIIPKVGSWLFSDFPYRCSPPVWGHKQHTQTPCSLEARQHHTWVTVTLAGCYQLHKVGQGRSDTSKNNLFLSLSLLATKTTLGLRLSTFRKLSPKLKTSLRDFPDPSKLLEMATTCVLLRSHQWVI